MSVTSRSSSAFADLKTGRSEHFHPTKIDGDWANDAVPAGGAGTVNP